MVPSIHKFSILGLLADDLVFDSRAKRAFSALSDQSNLMVLCYDRNPDSAISWNYKVEKVSASGALSRFLKLTIGGIARAWRQRPDLIYAEGLLPLVSGAFAKAFSGAKLVYDARELYLLDDKGESTYGPVHRLLEGLFIRFADLVLSPNEERAQFMAQFYKKYSLNFQVLKNIPPVIQAPNLSATNSWRTRLKLGPDDKLVVYQGAIGVTRGLDKILGAIPHTPQQIHYLFVIPENDLAGFNESLPDAIKNRVHTSPFLGLETLRGLLAEADAGIVVYNLKGLNNKFCAPNKLYEYSQMQLPMLTSPQPLFQKVQQKYHTCEVVDESTWEKGDHKKIAEHLLNLLNRSSDQMNFKEFNQDNNWPDQKQQFLKNIHALLSISKKSQRPKASSNTQWETL